MMMNSMATPAAPPATRIGRRFAELRAQKQMGLVAFLTAGDPDLAATETFVLAMAEAGADVIELGVPFSDPLADGPAIQRSSERGLRSGTTLAGVLDLVASIRRKSDVALVQEIEKAASVEAARAAVAERVRILKQAGLHGLSRREPGP
jgi:hypothetical protein